MTRELRVEHSNSTSTITADIIKRTRALNEQASAVAVVRREDWAPIEQNDLDPINDKLYIDVNNSTWFGGRLSTTVPQGAREKVVIESPEADARDAEPTAGNASPYQNVKDSKIVKDAINNVSTLSQGTIDTLVNSISYQASHTSQSKIIRDMRQATGAEIFYDSSWNVDYVTRLGTDTAIEVSPSAGNIGGEPTIDRDEREHITHIRVLGAQEGPNQQSAEATIGNYSSGRKVWRKYTAKDAIESDQLQEIANTLAAQYNTTEAPLEVEQRIYGEDFDIGDALQYKFPPRNIDQQLRIIKLTDVEAPADEGGTYQKAVLSNRALTTGGKERKRLTDLERFNHGYQGFVDRDNVRSGYNVAGDGTPQTLVIPDWPDDIVNEVVVDLFVQGREWRAPLDILGHTHDVTHPSHSHSVSGTTDLVPNVGFTSVYSNSGTQDMSSQSLESLDSASISTDGWPYLITASLRRVNGASETVQQIATEAAIDTDNDSIVEDIVPIIPSPGANLAENLEGESSSAIVALDLNSAGAVQYRGEIETSSGNSETMVWAWEIIAINEHDHGISETSSSELGTTETSTTTTPADAKVVTSFNGNTFYPTDVDIEVNGTLITTLSGNNSSTWQSTVDLTGELSAGQNTITATPTGERGALNLHLKSELFRRGV